MNNYNPFSQPVADLDRKIITARNELLRIESECNWYENFNYPGKTQEVAKLGEQIACLKQKIAETETETLKARSENSKIFSRLLSAIDVDIAEFKAAVEEKKAEERETLPLANLGWDPRRWFDSQRQANAKKLKEIRKGLNAYQRDVNTLEKKKAALQAKSPEERQTRTELLNQKPDPAWRSQEHARAAADLFENQNLTNSLHIKTQDYRREENQKATARKNTENAIRKYEKTNYAQLSTERENIERLVARDTAELARLEEKKHALDHQLKEPLKIKHELSNEIEKLQKKIQRAESLARELEMAEDSYERAMIHQQCAREFDGASTPNRVIQKYLREKAAAERNLKKIESRLEKIVRLANRRIEKIVIDGNNLCYEGEHFFGLPAVVALSWELNKKFEVTVIFDASIRHRLRMDDKSIRMDFPQETRIHIVAIEQAADETILRQATEDSSYVISNDRFAEFPDMSAVRDHRLIRHEILDGKLIINDLGLQIPYEQ